MVKMFRMKKGKRIDPQMTQRDADQRRKQVE
jgi:hypothetical protein